MENQRFVAKVEFERMYKEFTLSELNCINEGFVNTENYTFDLEEKEINDFMIKFVELRLSSSGGNIHEGPSSISNVDNFLNELELYMNLMADFNGCYHNEFCWEYYDTLEELVSDSNFDDSIKNDILNGFKERCGMNDEE
jgi:hypothetical protein